MLIAIFGVGVFSCKSLRPVRIPEGTEFDYMHVKERYIPNMKTFNSLSVPRLNVELISPDLEIGLRGNMRMVKDSAVFVSLNAGLGIELLRALVEKDQIQIIDRVNSSYEKMSFQQISSLIGLRVDYNSLEKILFNAFEFNELVSSQKVDISERNDFIVIHDIKNNLFEGFNEAKVHFRKNDLLVGRIEVINAVKGHFAYINYADFSDIGDGVKIPLEIEIFVNRSGEIYKLIIRYSKIDLNTVRNINFSVPSRYL